MNLKRLNINDDFYLVPRLSVGGAHQEPGCEAMIISSRLLLTTQVSHMHRHLRTSLPLTVQDL